MRAFEVNPSFQKHVVVCDTIAEAEQIYNKKYGAYAAVEIRLISEYVQVKGIKETD